MFWHSGKMLENCTMMKCFDVLGFDAASCSVKLSLLINLYFFKLCCVCVSVSQSVKNRRINNFPIPLSKRTKNNDVCTWYQLLYMPSIFHFFHFFVFSLLYIRLSVSNLATKLKMDNSLYFSFFLSFFLSFLPSFFPFCIASVHMYFIITFLYIKQHSTVKLGYNEQLGAGKLCSL